MKTHGAYFFKGTLVLLGVFFVLQLMSCGSGTGFDRVKALQLQQSLDRSVAELNIPGAVMGVRAPDGTTWFGASGYASLPQQYSLSIDKSLPGGQPMTTDLYFRIASVTKTFTATIILELVDEGKLALDDTIDQIVARWFSPDYPGFTIPYGSTMTLRNILEMRSGMVEYASTKEFNTAAAADPLVYISPRDLLRMSAQSTDPAPYPPDTRFEYCNTNFVLQGIIIEQVTGNTYAGELERRIITPLGLQKTFLPDDVEMPAPFAHGYLVDENGRSDASEATNPAWAWAAGGMISTVGDLLIWVKALVDGSFLSPETQQERMTMKEGVIDTWPISYGLGIYNDSGAVGHYGTYMGFYTSYCMRYQGYDLVVLENGELNEHHEAGRHPARSIFWNAVRDIGLAE